jgi:hypothetical protein
VPAFGLHHSVNLAIRFEELTAYGKDYAAFAAISTIVRTLSEMTPNTINANKKLEVIHL